MLALLFGNELVIESGQTDPVSFERGDLHRTGELVVVVDKLHVDGALRIERPRAQPLADGVVRGQVEALDDLLHQPARLEEVDLVVDVAARLESGQIAEGLQLDVSALAAVLHEDRGRAAVDLRRAGQVVVGDAEAEYDRKREPVPVVDHHADDVVQGDAGRRGVGLLYRLLECMVFHHDCLSYLVRVTMSVATEMAVLTSER